MFHHKFSCFIFFVHSVYVTMFYFMLHFPAFVYRFLYVNPGWPGMCLAELQLKYSEMQFFVSFLFVVSLLSLNCMSRIADCDKVCRVLCADNLEKANFVYCWSQSHKIPGLISTPSSGFGDRCSRDPDKIRCPGFRCSGDVQQELQCSTNSTDTSDTSGGQSVSCISKIYIWASSPADDSFTPCIFL